MKTLYSLFITAGLLIGFTLHSVADNTQSILKQEELSFSSNTENMFFKGYTHINSDNYFALLACINPGLDSMKIEQYRKTFITHVNAIKAGLPANASESKTVKYIYDYVNKNYLKKYELENNFGTMLETGLFNCVSSTALYSLFFEALGVPYSIKEVPQHVFIIAYPSTYQIKVETTDPVEGYNQYTAEFKNNFVLTLKQSKTISEDDYNKIPANQLFDKYYFSQESLSLQQLAGLQYLNDAFYKLQKQKIKDAYLQIEKAYFLYPTEKIGYMLISTGGLVLQKENYQDFKAVELLAKLARMTKYGVEISSVQAEFSRLTNNILIDNSNQAGYDKAYQYLNTNIADTACIKEISYIYYYEKARFLYNQGYYIQGMGYAENAYALRQDNADAQNLFLSTLGQVMRTDNDPDKAITNLIQYNSKFPKLKANNNFCSTLVTAYLQKFYLSYEKKLVKEGDKYASLFEDAYAEKKTSINIDPALVGTAYSLAATYYFRKGDYARSRAFLSRGLKIAPNNIELKHRLEALK